MKDVCYKGWDEKNQLQYQRKMIELIIRHGSAILTELIVCGFELTDEIVLEMQPLFGRLKKLHLNSGRSGEILLKMLSSWCPDLQDLSIIFERGVAETIDGENWLRFDGLHQTFQKLVSITIWELMV